MFDAVVRRLQRAAADLRWAFTGERKLVVSSAIGFLVVSSAGVLIAKLVDDVMGGDDTARLDPTILDWVVRHRSSGLTAAARAMTHLGDPLVVIVLTVCSVVGLSVVGRKRLALLLVASTVGATVATSFTKYVVDRPRPPTSLWLGPASGPAFPSGHATQSVACYAALGVVGWRLIPHRAVRGVLVALGALIAVGVGSSRVYLAVHWPSDVLCGWSVATMWLVALILAGWARPRLTSLWVSRPSGRRPVVPPDLSRAPPSPSPG